MIEEPQLVETEKQLTAVIRLKISADQMHEMMGPAISEVFEAIGAQQIEATGPWFTRYFRIDPEGMDFEVGVPVAKPVTPVGRVQPSELPATLVARTVYQGPYEGLGEAWGQFDAWVAAQGHRPALTLWEAYLLGPEASSDPSAWRTELNRPLLKG